MIDFNFDVKRELLILFNKKLLRFFIYIKIEHFLLLNHRNISVGVFFSFFERCGAINRFKFLNPVMSDAFKSFSKFYLMRVLILLYFLGALTDWINRVLLLYVTVTRVIHNLRRSQLWVIYVKLVYVFL